MEWQEPGTSGAFLPRKESTQRRLESDEFDFQFEEPTVDAIEFLIARRMFDLLDIHPAYDNQPTTAALRGLPHGDPEAVIFVAGKPIDALHRLKIEDDLHFLRENN